jgi:hypothetical protein
MAARPPRMRLFRAGGGIPNSEFRIPNCTLVYTYRDMINKRLNFSFRVRFTPCV